MSNKQIKLNKIGQKEGNLDTGGKNKNKVAIIQKF